MLQAMGGCGPGGAELFFVRLARALRDAGVTQHLVVRRNAYAGRRLRQLAFEPEELAFGGVLDVTTRPRLRDSIRRFRPQIVVTWMSRATRLCPAAGERASFVHVGRLGGYYSLRYYRNCRHLIGNTKDIVGYITRSGWPAGATHYLPNFVDVVPSPPAPRAAFDTPADAPLLLSMGRLHHDKAFDVLLKALADLPGAYLWIAGEGTLDARLKRQAQSAGVGDRTRFLGWREDAAALYAAADVYVCPSRIEPLGNVVIEAWASGKPVVAAASSGPAGLIEDECNGLLVPVDDAAALAAAIQRVLSSPALAAALARGGRESYEDGFTETSVVGRYLRFFDAILEEERNVAAAG